MNYIFESNDVFLVGYMELHFEANACFLHVENVVCCFLLENSVLNAICCFQLEFLFCFNHYFQLELGRILSLWREHSEFVHNLIQHFEQFCYGNKCNFMYNSTRCYINRICRQGLKLFGKINDIHTLIRHRVIVIHLQPYKYV